MSYMANLRKEPKDVYFGMLGYETATYSKHWEELSKAVTMTTVETEANEDDDKAEFDDETARIPPKTSVHLVQSQGDFLSFMEMREDMGCLLTVFTYVDQEERICTNRCRKLEFYVLTMIIEV